MEKINFLHCADLHLDAPFTTLGDEPGKASARRQDIREMLQKMVDIAEKECVHLFIVAGDLYEHNYVRRSTIEFVNRQFQRIPGTRVVLIPGNHDPDAQNSYYSNYRWSDNVTILSEKRQGIYFEEIDTLISAAIFHHGSGELVPPVLPEAVGADSFRFLLLHGTVDMNFSNKPFNPVTSAALAGTGPDYVAAGHFHSRGDDMGRRGCIYNPGSPEPLDFGEEGGHGIYLGSLSKDVSSAKKLEVCFLPLNKRSYHNVPVQITGCPANEQIAEQICLQAAIPSPCDDLYSITLKGYTDHDFRPDLAEIKSLLAGKCFFIRLSDDTAPDYDFEALKTDPGLKGLFTSKLLDRLEKAADPREREIITRALYLGIEALESGKVEISD